MRGTYFILCGDFIKIGFSNNIKKRMGQLQGGNPFKLYLIGVIYNKWYERELHSIFKHLKIRGEWFKLNIEIAVYINQTCDYINRGFLKN